MENSMINPTNEMDNALSHGPDCDCRYCIEDREEPEGRAKRIMVPAVVARVMTELEKQCIIALYEGRTADCHSIARLIGKLQVQHGMYGEML